MSADYDDYYEEQLMEENEVGEFIFFDIFSGFFDWLFK